MCENTKCTCCKKLTHDSFEIGSQRMTDEGFLVAHVVLGRTGIQEYNAYELPNAPYPRDKVVKVYRSPAQVFDELSMQSFEGKTVTNDHPPEVITTDNLMKYQKGYISKSVIKDGDKLRSELTITDKDAIKDIQNGKVEVSNGYTCDYDFTPGVTESGEAYDAQQINIRGNHVALVERGRCGSECRVLDNNRKGTLMSSEKLTHDDEMGTMKKQLDEMTKKLEQKDAELFAMKEKMEAQKDEYKKMKESSKDVEKEEEKEMDKKVNDKIRVIDTARKIIPDYKYEAQSTLDIKKDVIKHANSGVTLDSKSVEYVNARFDIIKEDLENQGFSQMNSAVEKSFTSDSKPRMSARDEMIEKMQNLWRK
jgi:uncharacterized protein